MNKAVPVWTSFLVFLLSGCVVDDPSKGGFIGGLVGDLSGKYDDRIARREAALMEAKSSVAEAKQEREALQAGAATRRQEATALKREVASVENDLDKLHLSIEMLRQQEQASNQDIGSVEAEIAALVADLDAVKVRSHAGLGDSEQRVTLLRAEISKLQRDVDDLLAEP